MFTYCKFCGLELHQLCFCLKHDYKLNLKNKDLNQAAEFRIKYYTQILATIPPSDRWLAQKPGYSIWGDIYTKWKT